MLFFKRLFASINHCCFHEWLLIDIFINTKDPKAAGKLFRCRHCWKWKKCDHYGSRIFPPDQKGIGHITAQTQPSEIRERTV